VSGPVPGLPWHAETAAMLHGLAWWIDTELACGAEAQQVALTAASAARHIASRSAPGLDPSPAPGGDTRCGAAALAVIRTLRKQQQ
jgi:hypothetical protein